MSNILRPSALADSIFEKKACQNCNRRSQSYDYQKGPFPKELKAPERVVIDPDKKAPWLIHSFKKRQKLSISLSCHEHERANL